MLGEWLGLFTFTFTMTASFFLCDATNIKALTNFDLHWRYSVGIWQGSYYRPQTKFAKVMFSRVFVHRGGLCPGGLCQGDPQPRTVKSGRYAFHWNAFLFLKLQREILKFQKSEIDISP